jgi:response regulator RpfG family c-di-GMP phosphodiesterase
MVSMVRAMGINTVVVANNKKQCLDIIASHKINLVICGWNTQNLDALSILTDLRSCEKTQEVPFIIISSIIDQEQIKQAVLNGVSEYLVPPFNKQIFENRIIKALDIPIRLSATNITEQIKAKRLKRKTKKTGLDILIVDDVSDNIAIIRDLIKDNYQVKAALNAKTALKICQSDSPPDLILLDIMMPEVDGLTLCKQLKQNPLTHNISIIFLTALSDSKDVVKGLSLGAVDYITKPIIPAIFLARLDVHTKLLLNQRDIQQQVDNLIEQSAQQAKCNNKIQQNLSHYMDSAIKNVQKLSKNYKSAKQLPEDLLALSYNLAMGDFFIDKKVILEKIKQSHLSINNVKKDLAEITPSLIDVFNYSINEKNIERFEHIPFNSFVHCDEKLFKILFMCLYQNAVEAAPRGSKITVESKQLSHSTLLSIHNVGPIAEEIQPSFDQLFVSSKGSAGTGVGVYLAFLIIEKLKGSLYFHSSEGFGTSFYIKLPK